MSLSRRLQARNAWRLLVAAAVVGAAVVIPAGPANAAVIVPPNTTATLTSANPVDNTPHAQNGDVRAFAQIGNTVYAGGSFTSIKAAGAASWTAQNYLYAYDVTTGAILAGFAPVLDGAVQALAVTPDGNLIVGGNFKNVNGVSRKNLVALNPLTGATVAGWVGRGDGGNVRRTIVVGNHLYIAGAFHWVNGTEHSLLARLNATTGAIDATFQIDASVARVETELVWGLAVSGNTLVAVGNFTLVNGLARNQVVMVENLSTTPVVANWSTDRFVAPCYQWAFPFYARDVDFSDDGSYFVIIADGGRDTGGYAYCDAMSRWETATRGANTQATWVDFTGADSVTSVEAADGVIYAAGHFRWVNNANGNDAARAGAVSRYGIAALDASNGMPLNWNPTRSGAPAGTTSWGPLVWELWRGPGGLYFGQDSDGMGNEYHGRMGLFPIAGGRSVPINNAPTATSGYLYLGAGDGQLTKVSFNGTTIGAPAIVSQPNLTAAGAAYPVGNKLYWSKTNAAAPSGSELEISVFSGGSVGAPWVGSGYNSWFQAANMSGAFYLNGRMYYTVAGNNSLFMRYMESDGYVVGCTQFTIPTQNIAWGTVRGLAWVNGSLVYGSTDGSLRSVAFDDSQASGFAVDGALATVVATSAADANWSNKTLFFATS